NAEAFAAIEATTAAIAAPPEDAFVEPTIIDAGKSLADALARFEAMRGADPEALDALGNALTREMPPIVADLRMKFSVSEPGTIADIPDDLKQDWLASDGRVRLRVLPDQDIGSPRLMKAFTETVQAIAPRASGP